MIPERESVAGRWVVGAMDVRKSSDPVTHDRLHCSWPASQPSSYHSDPKLRLTAWSNKARGLGLHPRRQMCNWRGERMEPEMLTSWHHLARVPLPPRGGEEKGWESVQSQQAQLLFLAWPHAAGRQRHGPGRVIIRLRSFIALFSSSALPYSPSHKNRLVTPLILSPIPPIFCPHLTIAVFPSFLNALTCYYLYTTYSLWYRLCSAVELTF